jgi:hypothetical protein
MFIVFLCFLPRSLEEPAVRGAPREQGVAHRAGLLPDRARSSLLLAAARHQLRRPVPAALAQVCIK